LRLPILISEFGWFIQAFRVQPVPTIATKILLKGHKLAAVLANWLHGVFLHPFFIYKKPTPSGKIASSGG
jgi:hypothetical protein